MTNIINALCITVLSASVLYMTESFSRFSISAKALAGEARQVHQDGKPLLLAKGAKKPAAGAKPAVRERTISREKVYRGESKKVDFDAITIDGDVKTPFGSLVNQNKANKVYDLIRPRLRWHDEMKQSTSSLENGRSGT